MINLPIIVNMTVESNPMVFSMSVETNPIELSLGTDTAINVTIIDAPTYDGDYVVDPLAHSAIVLETKNKVCTDNVTVNKIRTAETHNDYGVTFYIAEGAVYGN